MIIMIIMIIMTIQCCASCCPSHEPRLGFWRGAFPRQQPGRLPIYPGREGSRSSAHESWRPDNDC